MNDKCMRADVGDIFIDVAAPRHEWRVTERDGQIMTIERVDRAGAFRFMDEKDLLKTDRYKCKSQPAGGPAGSRRGKNRIAS